MSSVLRRERDRQVAGALADARRAAHGARAKALQGRALVGRDGGDAQVVADELVVVLGVGDGALQELAPVLGHVARGVGEDGEGLLDRLAADVVADQARLAGAGADVLGVCADDDELRRLARRFLLRGAAAATARLRLRCLGLVARAGLGPRGALLALGRLLGRLGLLLADAGLFGRGGLGLRRARLAARLLRGRVCGSGTGAARVGARRGLRLVLLGDGLRGLLGLELLLGGGALALLIGGLVLLGGRV